MSSTSIAHMDLPAVDDRLVAPGCGYEIEDGEIVRWESSDEVHGIIRCALGSLLFAHRGTGHVAGLNLLTRVTERDDLASHASVYPSAVDPVTGGRLIEDMAFQVVSTVGLARAAGKARKLTARGVRRVFALDVVERRAFEWSRELGTWAVLPPTAYIRDAALAVALPVEAMFDDKAADLATVRAYRAKYDLKCDSERTEGREEGREEGRKEIQVQSLRRALSLKFGVVDSELEARIAGASSETIDRYFDRIFTAATAAAVFADED